MVCPLHPSCGPRVAHRSPPVDYPMVMAMSDHGEAPDSAIAYVNRSRGAAAYHTTGVRSASLAARANDRANERSADDPTRDFKRRIDCSPDADGHRTAGRHG